VIWLLKTPLTADLLTTFDLIDASLEATTAGLDVADSTLTAASADITTIETTIQTAGKSIEDTIPLLETFTDLLDESLPSSISSVQTALSSAQAAAQSIESTLQLISSIPLLPLGVYAPEVPLTDALGEVSTSLDPIPQSFADMSEDLSTSKDNLTLIAFQIDITSRHVGDLKSNLDQVQLVLTQYQSVIEDLQIRVNAIQANLEKIVTGVAWFVTIFFVWLGVTQIGLLTQGFERVQSRGERLESSSQDEQSSLGE
jgi:ABC-type transporter Mla subunit MlaD